jgi:hypothetical protein
MKKYIITVISILFVIQSGCARSMRYSHQEIKDFPPPVQEQIKKGEISIGMSKVQVRYAWGGPDNIIPHKPQEDGNEYTEWVYKETLFFTTQLFFTDDRLTKIITNRPGLTR